MAWPVRIQSISYRGLAVLFGGALLWILVTVLLGALGPQVLNVSKTTAYQCPNGEHYNFNNDTCKGVEPGKGEWVNVTQDWSRMYVNRHWYLELTLYTDRAYPNGIDGMVDVWVMMLGSNDQKSWTLISNQTNLFPLKCQGGTECGRILYTIANSRSSFKAYQFRFLFSDDHGMNLLPLADVAFKFEYESAGFAATSIGVRLMYFLLSLGALGYLVKKQRDEFQFSPVEWSKEVQVLALILTLLVVANNPFYFMVYVAGAFFQYVDAFLELLFVCALVIFWFWAAIRLRLNDNESIKFHLYDWIKLGLLGLYFLLSFLQIVLVVSFNETSPMFSIVNYPIGIMALFLITSGIFCLLVASFYWDLYQAWVHAAESRTVVLLIYLAGPSALVAFAYLVGVVMGYVAVFNRPAAMFFFVISVYNVYVYYLVWAFWPEKTESVISNLGSASERSGLLAKVEEPSTPNISSSASSPLYDADDVL